MTDSKTNVNFLEDFSRREIELPSKNKKARLPIWLKIFFVITIIFVVFFSGIFFSKGGSIENESGSFPKIGISQAWTAFRGYVLGHEGNLEGKKEDRINILLLGMGGIGHEGPFLTDTIIIASIKPSTGQVSMISVPRDLYVPISGHGWKKINHANSLGETDHDGQGGKIASETIANIFNLSIHYYVRVDFSGFEQIIDDLGGVDIDVTRSFTDDEYPAPEFEYQVVSFNQGLQEMSGDTALKFVRSRHGNNGEGSDFARSKRQQKVILAIKDKALSVSTLVNPTKIGKMLKNLGRSINTNLTADEIIYLSKFVEDFSMDEIINFNFNSNPDNFLISDFTSDGAYILRPKSGNFNQLSNFTNNIFNQVIIEDPVPASTPAITAQKEEIKVKATEEEKEETENEEVADQQGINIAVLNGTKINGLAGRTASKLETAGFEVVETANCPQQDYEENTLYRIHESEELTDAIEKIKTTYELTVEEEIPEYLDNFVSQDLDFILVLGQNN